MELIDKFVDIVLDSLDWYLENYDTTEAFTLQFGMDEASYEDKVKFVNPISINLSLSKKRFPKEFALAIYDFLEENLPSEGLSEYAEEVSDFILENIEYISKIVTYNIFAFYNIRREDSEEISCIFSDNELDDQTVVIINISKEFLSFISQYLFITNIQKWKSIFGELRN